VRTIRYHLPLTCLGFASNGVYCGLGTSSGELLLYDLRLDRPSPIWVVRAHASAVTSIAIQRLAPDLVRASSPSASSSTLATPTANAAGVSPSDMPPHGGTECAALTSSCSGGNVDDLEQRIARGQDAVTLSGAAVVSACCAQSVATSGTTQDEVPEMGEVLRGKRPGYELMVPDRERMVGHFCSHAAEEVAGDEDGTAEDWEEEEATAVLSMDDERDRDGSSPIDDEGRSGDEHCGAESGDGVGEDDDMSHHPGRSGVGGSLDGALQAGSGRGAGCFGVRVGETGGCRPDWLPSRLLSAVESPANRPSHPSAHPRQYPQPRCDATPQLPPQPASLRGAPPPSRKTAGKSRVASSARVTGLDAHAEGAVALDAKELAPIVQGLFHDLRAALQEDVRSLHVELLRELEMLRDVVTGEQRDVAVLRAENERLRCENERLRAPLRGLAAPGVLT